MLVINILSNFQPKFMDVIPVLAQYRALHILHISIKVCKSFTRDRNVLPSAHKGAALQYMCARCHPWGRGEQGRGSCKVTGKLLLRDGSLVT